MQRNFDELDESAAVGEETQVVRFEGEVTVDGTGRTLSGMGSSPVAAFLNALRVALSLDLSVASLTGHPLPPANAKTASYIELCAVKDTTTKYFGVGVSASLAASRLRAVLSAANATLPSGHSFPPARRARPVMQSRSSSVTSIRVQDLRLRAGAPPHTFDTGEWRQRVEI
jgi:2-isopropylmalate synthase